MKSIVCILALASFCLCQSVQSTKLEILDYTEDFNIETAAEEVCNNNGFYQFSRASTIVRLDNHLENSFGCDSKTLAAVTDLRYLVEASPDNACSEEKIRMFKIYHDTYIRKNYNVPDLIYPTAQALEIFFKAYALEVSAICKKALLENVKTTLNDRFTDSDYHFNNPELLNAISNVFSSHFPKVSPASDYDDVILVWDFIEKFMAKDNVKGLDQYLKSGSSDPESPLGLFVKLKGYADTKMLQDKCRTQYRPVYSKLVLPIIRLANIGYSANFNQIPEEIEEIRKEDKIRLLYIITQFCESILPIHAINGDNLNGQDAVILDQAEARQLAGSAEPKQSDTDVVKFDPSGKLAVDDQLSVVRVFTQDQINEIVRRQNQFNRMLTLNLFFKQASNVRKAIVNKAKQFFSFGKSKQHSQVSDESSVMKLSDEQLLHKAGIDLSQLEDDSSKVTRTKRDTEKLRLDKRIKRKMGDFRDAIVAWSLALFVALIVNPLTGILNFIKQLLKDLHIKFEYNHPKKPDQQ